MAEEAKRHDNPDLPVDPNEPTYCICDQVSYGEMIGCDNEEVSFVNRRWLNPLFSARLSGFIMDAWGWIVRPKENGIVMTAEANWVFSCVFSLVCSHSKCNIYSTFSH